MEEEFSVRVRSGPPPPARLLPSERRYSASTALGLGLVHLALAALAVLLLGALWEPAAAHRQRYRLENANAAATAVLAAAATLTIAALIPGAAGLLAWHRWYEDRNIRWLLGAAAISAIGALASLATTSFALASVHEQLTTNHFLSAAGDTNVDPDEFFSHLNKDVERDNQMNSSESKFTVIAEDQNLNKTFNEYSSESPDTDERIHITSYPDTNSHYDLETGDISKENPFLEELTSLITRDKIYKSTDLLESSTSHEGIYTPQREYATMENSEKERNSFHGGKVAGEERATITPSSVNTSHSFLQSTSPNEESRGGASYEEAVLAPAPFDAPWATPPDHGRSPAGAVFVNRRRRADQPPTTSSRLPLARFWDPQATMSFALSFNLIVAALAEFAWSLWTLTFAWRGMRRGYPGDEDRRQPSQNPQSLTTTPPQPPFKSSATLSSQLRRPDIISNHQQKDPILQETTMPYQERVRRFLASETPVSAETQID